MRPLVWAAGRRGFTLVEMVVVMIIIAIVGAVVVPALARPPARDPAAFAAPLADVLRAARRLATDSWRAVRVVVDPASNRYVVAVSGSDSVREGTLAFAAGGGITTDSLRAAFDFDPAGPAYGDSVLVSADGQFAVLTVDRWTGDVVMRAR